MYSIGEVSGLTGISAFTLRYYEKIGVLPEARRQDGIRRYDERDLQFIRFIHGLKQTGMSLEDIAAFTEDGCLLFAEIEMSDIDGVMKRRIDMLDQHIDRLNRQIRQLETVKAAAEEKRHFYEAVLMDGEIRSAFRSR